VVAAPRQRALGPIAAAPVIGGKIAGCPNGNWSGISPAFEGPKTASLTITQAGNVIFGQVTINY
jgi:hypothetical protein